MAQTINISSDALQARILTKGAALVGLRFVGTTRNLVLGFEDPNDHSRIPAFAGFLAGPVANRVRGGRIALEGRPFQMPLNEAATNTLHSGPDGLHAQEWTVADQSDSHVTLTCLLADGQNGLPGNRTFSATYALNGHTLSLRITATTDQPTPINIAAHPYWNLDGSADISGYELQVEAPEYLPTDSANLPIGTPEPVANTLFDFRQPKAIPLDPALDVNYCLSTKMRNAPVPAAVLRGSDDTTLRIATTCPGLQVYAGAHLPREQAKMADCPPIAPYSGIALEPQHWPDAPHHSHFPQITLRPDETYTQITEYRLTAR